MGLFLHHPGGCVSINSTSYKRSDYRSIPNDSRFKNIPEVSINSTSYKRSDLIIVFIAIALGLILFPLIPLLIKEAISLGGDTKTSPKAFPLIPLLIKEAIAVKALLSLSNRVSINSTSYKRSDLINILIIIPLLLMLFPLIPLLIKEAIFLVWFMFSGGSSFH